jgi:hypothetical protein
MNMQLWKFRTNTTYTYKNVPKWKRCIIHYTHTRHLSNKIHTQHINTLVNDLKTNNSSYNEIVNSCDKDNHAILTKFITDLHLIQVVGSIPTVTGHIFQARPVRIYTQGNITNNNKVAFKCLGTGERFGGATLQTLFHYFTILLKWEFW